MAAKSGAAFGGFAQKVPINSKMVIIDGASPCAMPRHATQSIASINLCTINPGATYARWRNAAKGRDRKDRDVSMVIPVGKSVPPGHCDKIIPVILC